jgi:hypothetical protein
MKQVAGLLQKLSNKSSRLLVKRGKISCAMTKFDGSVVVNRAVDMGDYQCWLETTDLPTLTKGATLAPEGLDVFIRSAAGANKPLTRVDEGDSSLRYHDPANFDVIKPDAEFTVTTAEQKRHLLNILAIASTDKSRYIYGGLYINGKDTENPTFEATDGRVAVIAKARTYGITWHPRDAALPPRESVVIPRPALEVFLKLKAPIHVAWNDKLFSISCQLDGAEIVYQDRCLEGKFPDISRVIPEITHSAQFPCAEILEIPFVKRPPTNLITLEAQPTGPEPYLCITQNDDAGHQIIHKFWGIKADSRVTVRAGFNHAYLKAACALMGANPTIGFKFNTDNLPSGEAVFVDTPALTSAMMMRDNDTTVLVMPMKV